MLHVEKLVKGILPQAKINGVSCANPNKTVVLLRSGHGGRGGGARAFDGTPEWWINHAIARELFLILPFKHDVPVIWLNPSPQNLGNWLREGVYYSNQIHEATGMDCFFVSIHCNSFYPKGWSKKKPYNKAGGVEVYYKQTSCRMYNVAQSICKSVASQKYGDLSINNRGPKAHRRFYELKYTRMPAVLVEAGFLSNENDLKVLTNHTKKLSKAIAKGIKTGLTHGTRV